MEFSEDLLQRVFDSEKSKNTWKTKEDSTEFKEANFLNQLLFGEKLKPLEGCECLPTFYFKLHSMKLKNKIIETMEKQFYIKKGKVIMSHSFATPLGFHSSDEDCIKLLRSNENHINKFDKVPSNWREIVFGTATKKEAVKVEETVETENEVVSTTETPASEKVQPARKYKKRK